MSIKVKEKVYDIDTFSKEFYSLNEDNREITQWVPVLDKFIWSMINKYKNILEMPMNKSVLSLEDMYQIAWIAVLKAIPKYKPYKNIKFTTFVGRCIENEFKMVSRQRLTPFIDRKDESKGYFKFKGLDEPIKDMEGHDSKVLLKDIISDEYDFTEDNLLMGTFREWLSSYNKDRIRKILESFILKGMSQVDISKSLGITQPYVGRLLKVGVKDFKEYYYN